MLQEHGEGSGSQYTALFNSASDFEWLGHVDVKSNDTVHIAVKGFHEANALSWAADERQYFENAISSG